MRLRVAAMVAAAFMTGCATTDDPSKGGLISYWAHGEDAYQQRIQERQALLDKSQARAAKAEEETAALEEQRGRKQKEIEDLQARSDRLRGDIEELEQECRVMDNLAADTQAEKERLEQDMAALQKEALAVSQPPLSEAEDFEEQLREREKRIGELERDLKALRERASLLTTL